MVNRDDCKNMQITSICALWCFKRGCTTKTLLVMKLTTILLLAAILQVAAKTNGQTVTYSAKSVGLEKLFAVIKQQTGHVFFYREEDLSGLSAVSVSFRQTPLEVALQQILKEQPLKYSIQGKTIFIIKGVIAVPKPPAVPETTDEIYLPPPLKIRVTDSSGNPMPGASIKLKNSKVSGVTDAAGIFNLNANAGDVLIVSFVGYETKTLIVAAAVLSSANDLVVSLKPSRSDLDEVEVMVSSGYQQLPLERVTGAYTHITAAQLENSNSFNLKDRLEGMVPGMFFETQFDEDQSPNSERSRSIVIRGMGTFGNVNPLIVVDGAPFYPGVTDPWQLINPSDVASITVLKDAAAASIWGAQAANGVIVITTKSGGQRKNQPLVNVQVDYLAQPVPRLHTIPWASGKDAVEVYKWLILKKNYLSTLETPSVAQGYDLPEVMQVLLEMKRGNISEAAGNARLAELSAIDVREEFRELFFRKIESNKKINLTFSDGSATHNVRTSLTALMNDQYSKGNSDMQVTANIVDEYIPKKWLKFSFGSNIFYSNRLENGVLVNELANIPQMSRILDEDGSYLPMTINSGGANYYSVPTSRRRDTAAKYKLPYNWDWNLKRDQENMNKFTKTTNVRLYTNIQATLFKGLTTELFYQYQKDHTYRKEYYNENTWYVRDLVNSNARTDGSYPVPPGGMLYEMQTNGYSHNARLTANYKRNFGEHAISVLGGAEVRQNYFDRVRYGFYGYDPQSLTAITNLDFLTTITPKMSGLTTSSTIPFAPTQSFMSLQGADDRYVSTYGNAGYTFKRRYDLTGSIRLDRTNLYGQAPNYRNLPQWSVGAGWQISDEPFFDVSVVNRLKIRASYGFNGNVLKSVSPYILGYPWTDPVTRLPYAAVQSAPNPGLTWEKTETYNIGVDFSLLKGRINGNLEIYSKKGSDILAQIAINGTYGYQNNRAELNTGNINNNGIEVSIQGLVINNKDFKWSSRLNYGSNRNRAFNITQVNKTAIAYTTLSFYYHLPNQPVDFVAAAEWVKYDDNGQIVFMYRGKEHKVTDFPNSAAVNYGDLFKVVGQRNPKHFGQWANSFSYKKLELNISILYKLGHKFVGDYPATGLKNNYFAPSRFYTWIPELMVNSWKSQADGNRASMYSFDEKFTGTAAEISSYQTLLDYVSRYNTRNVMSASNIRLQSVALSYIIPAKFSGPFKNVRVQVEARNIGPIWVANKQGIDPDFPAYSSSVYGALQYVVRNREQYSAALRFGF